LEKAARTMVVSIGPTLPEKTRRSGWDGGALAAPKTAGTHEDQEVVWTRIEKTTV
jgi:hypothetical protein